MRRLQDWKAADKAETETTDIAALEDCTVYPHRSAPLGDHVVLQMKSLDCFRLRFLRQTDDPSLSVTMMSLMGSYFAQIAPTSKLFRGWNDTTVCALCKATSLHLAVAQAGESQRKYCLCQCTASEFHLNVRQNADVSQKIIVSDVRGAGEISKNLILLFTEDDFGHLQSKAAWWLTERQAANWRVYTV